MKNINGNNDMSIGENGSQMGGLKGHPSLRLGMDPAPAHQPEEKKKFEIGFEFTQKGQAYRLAGYRPYQRRDGSETMLVAWRSHCAQCGEEFEFLSPSQGELKSFNRRCQKHKRPGSKVRSDHA